MQGSKGWGSNGASGSGSTGGQERGLEQVTRDVQWKHALNKEREHGRWE